MNRLTSASNGHIELDILHRIGQESEIDKDTGGINRQGSIIWKEGGKLVTAAVTEIDRKSSTNVDTDIFKLAEGVEKAVNEASSHKITGLASKGDDYLQKLLSGAEDLKERITQVKESRSLFTQFFDWLFGETKYDDALRKASSVINILKAESLKKELTVLAAELPDLEANLKTKKDHSSTLNDEKNKKEFSDKIKKYEEQISGLETEKKEKTARKDKLDTLLNEGSDLNTKLSEAKAEYTTAEKDYDEIKKSHGVARGTFGKIVRTITEDPPEVKKAKTSRDLAESKMSELEKQKTALEKEKQTIASQLKEIESTLEQVNTKLSSRKEGLKNINERLSEILQIESSISDKKKSIEEKKSTLETLKNSSAKAPAFQIAVDAAKIGKRRTSIEGIDASKLPAARWGQVLDKLGPTKEGSLDKYIQYQFALMFGFCAGRKEAIEDLAKNLGASEHELKGFLEGGNATDNMCYISHYLQTLISQTSDKSYNSALQKLKSDLDRSIPYAIHADPPSSKGIPAFSAQMADKIGILNVGEKFLLPTNTSDHQTLLVFEKLPNGRIQITHYNTGEGAEVVEGSKVKVAVKYTVNSPTELTPVINQILELKASKTATSEKIKEALSQLGNEETAIVAEGQSGEICSFEVMRRFVEVALGDQFERFDLDFSSHIQDDFQKLSDAFTPPQNEREKQMQELRLNLLQINQTAIEEKRRKH